LSVAHGCRANQAGLLTASRLLPSTCPHTRTQDHAALALAGDSVDLLLTGVDASALRQGCVLCHPEFPVRLAMKFTAQVLVLDVGLPLLKGHAVTIHAHTAREAGVISHLAVLCDAKTGAVTKQRPRCLLAGQVRWLGCVAGLLSLRGSACQPFLTLLLCCSHVLQTALIEVTPVRPFPLEAFGDVKALGRVALREGGRTVAVGIVTAVQD
jgi:elongation factor 1 alpha-like protein